MTDKTKKIIYVNPLFVRLLGYSLDELKDKEFRHAFPVYDLNEKPISSDSLDDVNAKAAGSSVLRVFLQGKTAKLPVIINTAPIIVNGTIEGVVRTIYDYTPEREKEKQKDDFFSFASHELRTPLAAIKGNVQMVMQGFGGSSLSDTDKESLTDATTSAARLVRLVNEFLNVSRIDQGRIEAQVKDVDVCAMITTVVKEMDTLYTQKNLHLTFACEEKHLWAKADEDKLKEIFINLLGNSLKFTEKGGVTVTHSVKDARVRVEITDTGMGIPVETAKHLFERFKRATDEQGARAIEGSGMGLFICRQFAQLMGGDVWIEKTAPGAGTTFIVSLPLANHKG